MDIIHTVCLKGLEMLGIDLWGVFGQVVTSTLSGFIVEGVKKAWSIFSDSLRREIFEAVEESARNILGNEIYERFKEKARGRKIKSKEDLIELLRECGSKNPDKDAENLICLLPKEFARKFKRSLIGEMFIFIKYELERLSATIEDLEKRIDNVINLLEKEIKKLEKNFENLIGLIDDYKAKFVYMPINIYMEVHKDEFEEIFKYEWVNRSIEGNNAIELLGRVFESKRIVAIFGDGGMGKTRLALEFAKRMAKKGVNVYFVNYDFSEYKEPSELENALIILDDASKFGDIYVEKIIRFCLGKGRVGRINAKLLILDRTYFKERIVEIIKANTNDYEIIELKRDDKALRELLRSLGIEKDIMDEIIEKSMGIFFYAIVLAEYYKQDGKIDLEKALENRISKYINEIKSLFKEEYEGQIRDHLRLISLIQPLKKKDLIVLEKLNEDWDFPIKINKILLKILKEKAKGLIFSSDEDISIKPDPLADYIRYEWMFDGEKLREEFREVVFKLLEFIPYRIPQNIYNVRQIIDSKIKSKLNELESVEDIDLFDAYLEWISSEGFKQGSEWVTLLTRIWKKLNEVELKGEEFFKALVLFTSHLRDLIVVNNIEYANIEEWVKHEHKLIHIALTNLIGGYHKAMEKIAEKERKDYREVYKKFKDKVEVCLKAVEKDEEELAVGLTNISLIYAQARDVEKLNKCLKRQRNLRIKEWYENTLVNVAIGYAKVDCEKVDEVLDELKSLNLNKYAEALYSVIDEHRKAKRFEKVENYLKILEKVNNDKYLKAVCNIVFAYGESGKIEKMKEWVEGIWNFRHEAVAKTLLNATAFDNDVERLKNYIIRLVELDYPIWLAIGLKNVIRQYLLENVRSIEYFDNIFEFLSKKLDELKLRDLALAFKLGEAISEASYMAVIFYVIRHEFEKAKKYVKYAEYWKPWAVWAYSELGKYDFYYLLKAYKNRDLLFKVPYLEFKDKANDKKTWIEIETENRIYGGLTDKGSILTTINTVLEILGEEDGRKLIEEIASIDDNLWEKIYKHFKVRYGLTRHD